MERRATPATRRLGSPRDDPLGWVLRATQFAAAKHRNQRRKDPDASPYINHPIALASLLHAEAGIDDPVVLCAALLHDTIEDTETTVEELQSAFGQAITRIVLEVSDDQALPKPMRKKLQIEHAAQLSRRAKLVKLADKTCNLRDVANSPPPTWPLRRRRAYFEWAKKVVDNLRGVHPGLEKLFDEAYAGKP